MDLEVLLDLITLVVIASLILLGAKFLPAYIERKAANLATKEDIEQITQMVESVKHQYAAELERLRVALRGSDTLFQKRLDAKLQLDKLIASISPRMHHPEMDWHEACDDIAHHFDRLEPDLQQLLALHDVALSDELRADLKECVTISAENKFEVSAGTVSRSANAAAGRLSELLQGCSDRLRLEIEAYTTPSGD